MSLCVLSCLTVWCLERQGLLRAPRGAPNSILGAEVPVWSWELGWLYALSTEKLHNTELWVIWGQNESYSLEDSHWALGNSSEEVGGKVGLYVILVESRVTGKDPDAGEDWRQDKGTTEDEMVGWHHRLDGHEFEQAPGVGDGQRSLACKVGHVWAIEMSGVKHILQKLLLVRRSRCPL